jgi:hypothetical protein
MWSEGPRNGAMYGLHAARDYTQILKNAGDEAYVRAIAADYGPTISRSGDLRLFRHLRTAYAGANNVALDRLFVVEISKLLPPDLQRELIKELPRTYRRQLERWNRLPRWVRFILRLNTE